MTIYDNIKERLSTVLNDASHKIRTKLLVAASTGIVIFHTGLVPEKIEGLGIEFSLAQQSAMLLCLLILIVFLFISFLIASASDIVSKRVLRKSILESSLLDVVNEAVEKSKGGNDHANAWYSAKMAIKNISEPLDVSQKLVTFLSGARLVWDIFLPICIALYSISVLTFSLCHSAA